MSERTLSSLSLKRVFISLFIVALVPAIAKALNIFVKQEDISMMFALNQCGSLLIMYDWNLFGIHYNRSKAAPQDFLIYFLLGMVLLGLWLWIGKSFLQSHVVLPKASSLIAYGYARPGMMIAFSFMEATVVNIGFKCLTDHLDVRTREIQAILISGLLFGLVFTLLFTPWDLALWFRTYLYNLILISILSYLYNQSSSFMPGMLAMCVVYLGAMTISIL